MLRLGKAGVRHVGVGERAGYGASSGNLSLSSSPGALLTL